jgi:hypothetical protein
MGQLNPIGVRLAHGGEYFVEFLFLEIEHSKQHLVQPHPINTQALVSMIAHESRRSSCSN